MNSYFLKFSFLVLFLSSCSSLKINTKPLSLSDTTDLLTPQLSEDQRKQWILLHPHEGRVPGMSVEKTYDELIKDHKGKKVIVAVLDTGIDIQHEDLIGVIWTNAKEVADNGIDDDQNGYIDDIHGWNFLGKTLEEQYEYIRLLKKGIDFPQKKEAQKKYDLKLTEAKEEINFLNNIYNSISQSHDIVKQHLQTDQYGEAALDTINTNKEALLSAVNQLKNLNFRRNNQVKDIINSIEKEIKRSNKTLTQDLSFEYHGRKTQDDADDFSQTQYGDNNVQPMVENESHGTHVAGIIAGIRTNNLGMIGVAHNVEIMPVRVVPNKGDEYDKDIALGIRYAVDNGADIINMSFGKGFSPHADKVREAIVYAASKDVLLVNAAGNDNDNLDQIPSYPNDSENNGAEVSDNVITVGALSNKFGENMMARFSNYGKINVDVFAPGVAIYSTIPENKYASKSGTSMAAPAVAGVAALLKSHFPKLKASELKQILMTSGLTVDYNVRINKNEHLPLREISSTGKMVNAYNAFIYAANKNKSY